MSTKNRQAPAKINSCKGWIWIPLFLLLACCHTYQPVEIFPSLSAPLSGTGRRWVDPFFPAPGEAVHLGEMSLDQGEVAAPTPPEASGYVAEALTLNLATSADGSYRIVLNVPIPMRDGARLLTDLYFPAAEGRYPAILERTPFNRRDARYSEKRGPLFAKQGFIYIIQNVRGLFGSEDVFFPFKNEENDGLDMHAWIAAQPWYSGVLGAMGSGYGAYAACLAAADAPALKAMIIETCSSDLFLNGGLFLNGVPQVGCLHAEITWRLREFPSLLEGLRWNDALFHLPLREMDDVLGHPLPFWDDSLLHASYDYYWELLSLLFRIPDIDSAVLHVGGWHDPRDGGGIIDLFRSMEEEDRARGRSGRQFLVVGPWSGGMNSETFLGFYDFTENSRIDAEALYSGWFSKWLLGIGEAQGLPPAPVRVFLMGSNTWLDLPTWPPENIELSPYFLHSDGKAARAWEGGTLTIKPPLGFEEIDSFVSDPDDPVLAEMELGTDDQRPVEQREDVLTYTTPPLAEDLTLIGSPQVVLYVNTMTPDTDVFVMLTDVDEYGFSRPLSYGVLRMRYRDSFQAPSPVSPADILECVIDLSPTANRFLKGHSIRLNVMGSYFPFLTRNTNTGSAIGQDSETRETAIFLLHDFDYPSRLVLPVVRP